MVRYYLLVDEEVSSTVKAKVKQYKKECREFKKKVKSLDCDIGGLVEEVVGSNRRVVGFTFKNHMHVDKSQFLKEHWPIGVPKVSSPAGKLIRKSAPVLDVHAFLEDTLDLKPFFEFKNGGFLIRRISFGIYGDTVVVAVPAEMKVTPKHCKWIKRITDVEFEKISGGGK